MPSQGGATWPVFSNWSSIPLTRLMGVAKPMPMLPCCEPINRGIDADHIAMRIEQRSAAVAGIDCGIGLDHAFELAALLGLNGAVKRANDSRSQGAPEFEGVANGKHLLPHHQIFRIANTKKGQLARPRRS